MIASYHNSRISVQDSHTRRHITLFI